MKRVLLIIGLWLGVISACTNPIDGLEIKFKQPYPVALDVQYYTKGGTDVPVATQVIVAGPDEHRLITTVNTKKFRISQDGTLFLSIDSLGPRPTAQHPLHFTLAVRSPGFYDAVLPVQISGEQQRSVTLVLQPINSNSPIKVAQSFVAGQGILENKWRLATPGVGDGLPIEAVIAKGTHFKDVTGQEVNGNITARFQNVDINRPYDTFLINPITHQTIAVTDESGTATQRQLTQPAGAFLLQLYNDRYQLVKALSVPITVRFTISPQLYHTQAHRVIREGDSIPLFSYDAATDKWQNEPAGKVKKGSNGQLEYVAEISHLSLWVAGFTKQYCTSGPTFQLKSNAPNTTLQYQYEVYNDATGASLQRFNATANNGDVIRVKGLENNQSIRLRITNTQYKTSVSSASVDACSASTQVMDVTSLSIPKESTPEGVLITLQFPCTELDKTKLPAQELFGRFRETGTLQWKPLPNLKYTEGKSSFSLVTNLLEAGKTYDFQAGPAPGYYAFSEDGHTLQKAEWLIKIRTTEYCKQ